MWSLPTYRFAYTLTGHQNWVRSCQFSPDGRLAVSGGDDKTVKVGAGGWVWDGVGLGLGLGLGGEGRRGSRHKSRKGSQRPWLA